MDFDPYYKWLAIAPNEQPPNLYRLLGVNLFEADPDVIEMAADQRMAHVRQFQTGPHSELSQRLLNELASARVRLLSPERKAAYDSTLMRQVATPAVVQPYVQPLPPPPDFAESEAALISSRSDSPAADPLGFLTPDTEREPEPSSSWESPPPFRITLAERIARRRPIPNRRRLSPLAIVLLAISPLVAIVLAAVVASNSNLGEDDSQRPPAAHGRVAPTVPPRVLPSQAQSLNGLRSSSPAGGQTSNGAPAPSAGLVKKVNVRNDLPRRGDGAVNDTNPPRGMRIIPPIVKPQDEQVVPDAEVKPEPPAAPTESEHTEPITLKFDKDEIRVQIPIGDVPKESQLELVVLEPAEKVVESKATIKSTQRLLLNKEPRIEVAFEVAKSKPGYCVLKITPWLGNRVKGIPCNLTRMQQMSDNLPGQIQNAQATLDSVNNDIAAWQSHLQSLLNENHGPPGADPTGQIQQQVAIREAKAKLTGLSGRQSGLGRSIDRWTAQVAELPNDMQLVSSLVGTSVRYRIYFVANGQQVEVGKK